MVENLKKEIKMSKKISLSEEYDNYVLQYVDSYVVSQLVGVGKYNKKTFKKLPKAIEHYVDIKNKNPIVSLYKCNCLMLNTSKVVHKIYFIKSLFITCRLQNNHCNNNVCLLTFVFHNNCK